MVIDVVVVVLLAVALIVGWRGGLVGRLGAWVGFAIGALGSARWATAGIDALNIEGKHQRLAAAVLGVLACGVLGHVIGWRLIRTLRNLIPRPFRWIDSVAGALTGLGFVALVVWLMVPPLSASQGWPNQQLRDSRVFNYVEQASPWTPNSRGLLDRLFEDWNRIHNFEFENGLPRVGIPPTELSVAAEVLEQAAKSVLRVSALSCGRTNDGTAVVISPGLALTNAHVVAGATKVEVALPGENPADASVTAFDPERDLALIRTESTLPVLALEAPLPGQLAAVIGHPDGGPLRTAPIRMVERVTANGRDLYDSVNTSRRVWFAAAQLSTGDSGAPVVDQDGSVLGVVFAIGKQGSSEEGKAAYVLDRTEISAFMSEVAAFGERSIVNTGRCIR